MKRLAVIIGAVMVCLTLMVGTSTAYALYNTLYEQEGLAADGYAPIDASGQAPGANPNSTNWKYQYGSYSWFGVYSWDENAWVEETESGNGQMEIEADIEMFCYEELSNHKIYFHLGNMYTATGADLTAYVGGSFASNNGQYIGVSFDGTSKVEADFQTDGGGGLTGRITDAMIGTVDIGGRDISGEAFDVTILMDWGSGWQTPDSFGDGAHGTIPKALWWLVNAGVPGSYSLTYKIVLHPDTYQPDGNYNLDPTIVAAPVL